MKTQRWPTQSAALGDDSSLIKAIAAQDQNALQLFYKRYASAVYAFAARRLSAVYIAEEVTNDTFIQVWRSAMPV